ncbi:MAG: nucleotidyltransferase family protein [Dehalococcoidia bacterium]|nr:nucleotidyltransferase family protein [Dehalococcoidia bacterium]
MSIAALLLAAGESTRMGSPKPLLPWNGETLVQYQVRQLRDAGANYIVAVLGHLAEQVQDSLVDLDVVVVINGRYKEGRASSVRAGAEVLKDGTEAVILLSVDQPRPSSLVKAILETHRSANALITIPTFHGRRGHPTVFSGLLIDEMSKVTEENLGIREVVTRHSDEIVTVEVDSPLALEDLNTPEDYDRVRQIFLEQPGA